MRACVRIYTDADLHVCTQVQIIASIAVALCVLYRHDAAHPPPTDSHTPEGVGPSGFWSWDLHFRFYDVLVSMTNMSCGCYK